MRVVITGASGLIGRALTEALLARGDAVVGVSRAPGRRRGDAVRWIGWDGLHEAVRGCDAVVHLAGADIAAGRWTEARKRELRQSRVDTAARVVGAIAAAEPPPRVLVSASAVGYYGDRGAEELSEASAPGSDALAELCQAWEAEAAKAPVRTVVFRIGVVLSSRGGALRKLLVPFRLGLGGTLGSGEQYMSWVHIDDMVRLILFAIDDERVRGVLNATAPQPVTNREFSKALGRVLRRPVLLRVPAFVLRLQVGEGAVALVSSQRALPRAAQALGFTFDHPQVVEALADVLRRRR